ncbi:MAG: hypothetical protein EBX63_12870 [Betaproteobacteria bacterium]|nr:hypothetical protein [Betaproteobacteria bacterium]
MEGSLEFSPVTEAVFLDVRGVVSVESGYCGGKTNNPDYESICSGTTGHAEVVRVADLGLRSFAGR